MADNPAPRLIAALQAAIGPFELLSSDCSPWASVTFTGARHHMELVMPMRPDIDAIIAALPETDLPMHGQFVADLHVTSCVKRDADCTIGLEILTVSCE